MCLRNLVGNEMHLLNSPCMFQRDLISIHVSDYYDHRGNDVGLNH